MQTENPSEENRAIAHCVAMAFGGTFRVNNYYDEAEQLSIPILWCSDRPVHGVTSYSTVGLSDYPMRQEEKEFPARLELVGACGTATELFPNLLSTASFYIMRSQWLCYPGVVLQDAVTSYGLSSTMSHLYFTAPFLWEKKLTTLKFKTKTVAWLLAMPISVPELKYRDAHGDKELELLFERAHIDVFDVNRPSAV